MPGKPSINSPPPPYTGGPPPPAPVWQPTSQHPYPEPENNSQWQSSYYAPGGSYNLYGAQPQREQYGPQQGMNYGYQQPYWQQYPNTYYVQGDPRHVGYGPGAGGASAGMMAGCFAMLTACCCLDACLIF